MDNEEMVRRIDHMMAELTLIRGALVMRLTKPATQTVATHRFAVYTGPACLCGDDPPSRGAA